MAELTCDVGDLVQLTLIATTKATGAAVDPTTVTLKVKDPSGSAVTYTISTGITKDSTGNYHYDLSILLPGRYYYRWIGTGTGQAQEEDNFYVRTPEVT